MYELIKIFSFSRLKYQINYLEIEMKNDRIKTLKYIQNHLVGNKKQPEKSSFISRITESRFRFGWIQIRATIDVQMYTIQLKWFSSNSNREWKSNPPFRSDVPLAQNCGRSFEDWTTGKTLRSSPEWNFINLVCEASKCSLKAKHGSHCVRNSTKFYSFCN